MIHDVEKLYDTIFDAINDLVTVGEDPDQLFDCIIDHFAFMAEDGARRQKAYGALLNKFRDNDPILTIPEEPAEVTEPVEATEKVSEAIEWDVDEVPLDPKDKIDFFGNMNDINRSIMSENADEFLNFLKKMDLPDTLDS